MDTNVIGRLGIAGEEEPVSPRIKRIFVRDIRGDSAYGIGLADVTTRRLVDNADWKVTGINAQTSGFSDRVKVPHIEETGEKALEWALRAGPRVVRIKNTLHLDALIVSEAVCKDIEGRDTIEVLGPAEIWDDVTS